MVPWEQHPGPGGGQDGVRGAARLVQGLSALPSPWGHQHPPCWDLPAGERAGDLPLLAPAGGQALSLGWTPGMACVCPETHPQVFHFSVRDGGPRLTWWASPRGGLSAVGARHVLREPSPNTLPGTPVQRPSKAGCRCGSCISREDAVRGCAGALPVPGPRRGRARAPCHSQATAGHIHAVRGPRMPVSNVLLHFFFQ